MDIAGTFNRAVWTALQMFGATALADLAGVDVRFALGRSAIIAVVAGWLVVLKEVARHETLKAAERSDSRVAQKTVTFLQRRDR